MTLRLRSSGYFMAGSILMLLTSVLPAAAQSSPPCPEEQQAIPITEPSVGHNQVLLKNLTFEMLPCQTLEATVTVTPNQYNNPTYIGGTVSLLNSTNDELATVQQNVPSNAWSASLPIVHGTRSAGGLVKKYLLYVSSSIYQSYTVTLTFTLKPRPGYNTGGDTIGTAPLADSDHTYIGSLNALESPAVFYQTGQYWKCVLEPDKSVYITGQATGHPTAPRMLRVEVFNANHVFQAQLFGQQLTGTHTFASQTYTNSTTSNKTIYIKLRAEGGVFSNFSANFWLNGHKPQLTLYLDIRSPDDQDTFLENGAQPEDESTGYIPGARLDGTSELVPTTSETVQSYLRVIAAYKASTNGRIVAPPSSGPVTLSLIDISSYPGFAMNNGESTDPDFLFPLSYDNSSPTDPDAFASGQTIISVPFTADHTARAPLNCNDYGGFVTVTAAKGADVAEMKLPLRGATHLPSGGWKVFRTIQTQTYEYAYELVATVAGGLSEAVDSDPTPASVEVPGDNLTAFEEYRGFIIKDRHHRLDPSYKDVFIDNASFATQDLVDARQIGVRWHEIRPSEMSPTRRINHNATNIEGHVDQQGLILFNGDEGFPSGGTLGGRVRCPVVDGAMSCYPNVVGSLPPGQAFENRTMSNNIQVDKCGISNSTPGGHGCLAFGQDQLDFQALWMAIGHEIGHALGMESYPESADPDDPWRNHNPAVDSIMRPRLIEPVPAPEVAHTYKERDLEQLRLK